MGYTSNDKIEGELQSGEELDFAEEVDVVFEVSHCKYSEDGEDDPDEEEDDCEDDGDEYGGVNAEGADEDDGDGKD